MRFDLNKTFNLLFDDKRIRLKSTGQLSCDFVDQVVVRRMFPIFHDSDDASLKECQRCIRV